MQKTLSSFFFWRGVVVWGFGVGGACAGSRLLVFILFKLGVFGCPWKPQLVSYAGVDDQNLWEHVQVCCSVLIPDSLLRAGKT